MLEKWNQKLRRVFPGKVVSKGLVADSGLPRLPRFVTEHLIAEYITEENRYQKLQAMRENISSRLPESANRELVKSKLVRNGELLVVDKLSVSVNLRTGAHIGSLTYLGAHDVEVLDIIIDKYPRLLSGGLWGAYRLSYKPGGKKGTYSVVVTGMAPFQVSPPSVDELIVAREQFSLNEWVDVLIASVGYAPDRYDFRTKLLLLTRLLPAVEPNYNAIELGPRQTGKTFLLRNVSPSVYTASGANVSVASLFANMSTGTPGILYNFKTVVLDEIADTRIDNEATVSMLKDFMESGQFARGGHTYSTDASVVMTGNLETIGGRPADSYRHLFEELPALLQDVAFLDRVHAYVPGWEIPKITPAAINTGDGLVVDYLGQLIGGMRTIDRRGVLRQVQLSKELTKRDVVALEKTTSGLVKLLFPHDQYTEAELNMIVDHAVDLRRRVVDQLVVMAPGEFPQLQEWRKNRESVDMPEDRKQPAETPQFSIPKHNFRIDQERSPACDLEEWKSRTGAC